MKLLRIIFNILQRTAESRQWRHLAHLITSLLQADSDSVVLLFEGTCSKSSTFCVAVKRKPQKPH